MSCYSLGPGQKLKKNVFDFWVKMKNRRNKKTCVINDPLGWTHNSHLKVVLFCDI